MLNVRRLYILAAAFVGLLLFMHGSSELLRLVFQIIPQDAEFGLGSDWWREQLSLNLALVAVGTPLWLGHWLWAQRLARNSAEEGSALRSLFFLGVLGVTLIASVGAAGEILFVPFSRVAGGSSSWPALLDSLAALIIYGLFWSYHVSQRPPAHLQSGAAATITRWYWYAASFGSLGILVTSLIPLFSTMLQRMFGVAAVDATWWELPVAENITWVILGSLSWTFHWTTIQSRISDAESADLRSALRKVYLYLMVGSAAAGALLAVGRILYLALLSALGAVEERLGFVDDLTWVAPVALVAATGWFYHRHHLQNDAALVTELPRQAAIRRIYSYLLSAIGISLLAVGAFGILRLVIGILTGRAGTLDLPENFLAQQLSLYVTLLLVGLIAWVWYWRQIQHQLDTDSSAEERASLVRRIYLYVVSAAGVIAVVVAIGTLLYEVLRLILGTSAGNDFIDALNIHASVGIIAVVALLYHVRFLRQEHGIAPLRRAEEVSEVPAPPAVDPAQADSGPHTLVVTFTGGDLSRARALIEQTSLPEGTEFSALESSLSSDEVRQRLQTDAGAEE